MLCFANTNNEIDNKTAPEITKEARRINQLKKNKNDDAFIKHQQELIRRFQAKIINIKMNTTL